MKKLILCADDFGQDKSINAGILELINNNVLTAVSCMTNGTHWNKEYASNLKPHIDKIDIGLHLNFTHGKPLCNQLQALQQFPTLTKLITINKLTTQQITDEITAQINEFEKHMGQLPDFIDGHHHILNLPKILNPLLKIYKTNLQTTKPYIRKTYSSFTQTIQALKYSTKPIITAVLSKWKFPNILNKYNIPTNTTFSGFYNFNNAEQYSKLFQQFLKQSEHGGIIMCHPAQYKTNDEISVARVLEYNFLLSNDLREICSNHKITFEKFNKCQKHIDF